MRVAIMGAGSLGTVFGAYIAKAGRQVDFIDVDRAHVEALKSRGATVCGKVSFTVPVKALLPEQMEGIYDLVFYLTKQTNNDVALKQLLTHLGPNSVVCTMQNGLPEPAVAKYVGEERTIGCPVAWGAIWIGPGVSELASDPGHMEFDVGSISGEVTDKVRRAQAYLQLMCHTNAVTNLMGIRWTKLLTNATFSGMSSCLGCTFGEIMDNPFAMRCIQYIARETIAVAKAAGIEMEPVFGYRLDERLYFETDEQREETVETYQAVWTPHRALKSSMLQDLEKGRKSEINAINGVVCDYGRRAGVATPVNDKVVEIIRSIEGGTKAYTLSNLELFEAIVPQD